MRDLIATQNLDSFTAQLLGRCSGNWFLQIIVRQKCAGFIVGIIFCFDIVIHQIWGAHWFFIKATSILQHQQNVANIALHTHTHTHSRKIDRMHLFNAKKKTRSSVLLIQIYSAAKFLLPSQMKWTRCPFPGVSSPVRPVKSLKTDSQGRGFLSNPLGWRTSSAPALPSCAAILNRYLIRWPSRCLMPC